MNFYYIDYMEVKDRVYIFIEYKKISVKKFEEQCDLSNGYVASMRKGFGREKLENVLKVFPELNRQWLLFGEGEMLKSPEPAATSTTTATIEVAADAWEIIRQQAASLEKRDREIEKRDERIDRLLALLEEKDKARGQQPSNRAPLTTNPNNR